MIRPTGSASSYCTIISNCESLAVGSHNVIIPVAALTRTIAGADTCILNRGASLNTSWVMKYDPLKLQLFVGGRLNPPTITQDLNRHIFGQLLHPGRINAGHHDVVVGSR